MMELIDEPDVPRNSANLSSDRLFRFTPSMTTSPPSGLSSVPMMCSNVDLPAPEGPTIVTTLLFSIVSETFFRTLRLP